MSFTSRLLSLGSSTGNASAETAGAPDDEIAPYPGLSCAVKRIDDRGLDQGIHLDDDPGRLAQPGVPLFATDQLDDLFPEAQRRHQELPPAASLGIAGQEIEQLAGILAEIGAGGEEADIGVDPGGRGVV